MLLLTGDNSKPRKILKARANPSKHNRSYRFAGIAMTYTTYSCFDPSPVNYTVPKIFASFIQVKIDSLKEAKVVYLHYLCGDVVNFHPKFKAEFIELFISVASPNSLE